MRDLVESKKRKDWQYLFFISRNTREYSIEILTCVRCGIQVALAKRKDGAPLFACFLYLEYIHLY